MDQGEITMSDMKLIMENWRKFLKEEEEKPLSPQTALDKEGGAIGMTLWQKLTGMSKDDLKSVISKSDHLRVLKKGDIADFEGSKTVMSEQLSDYVFEDFIVDENYDYDLGED